MKAPKRKRPRVRERIELPAEELESCASTAVYVGSPEHKTLKTFAGPPLLRSDATPCPPHLTDQASLTDWLREGILAGDIGAPVLEGYPRYVWVNHDDRWYEAMLTNQTQGWYKGYPITNDEAQELL